MNNYIVHLKILNITDAQYETISVNEKNTVPTSFQMGHSILYPFF